jgi:peptidoglycan L-alanyl-D-glutamate endopeptidase CwlK
VSNFKFGPSSLARLDTCDVRLQQVAKAALEDSTIDFGIACGHRGQEEQDRAVAEGKSKTPWPTSKHNSTPSRAFDFFPVVNGKADWNDIQKFKDIAHHILMTADRMGVKLRWGGDWNCNGVEDDKWYDRPHVELKG